MTKHSLIEQVAYFSFCMGYVTGSLKCGDIRVYLLGIGVSETTMEAIIESCDRINNRLKEMSR